MKNFSFSNEKHNKSLPSLRHIRRSCQRELYRTVKKLNTYINADQLKEAEQVYLRKVVLHLPWISENGSNRKRLADWWEEQVCADIASIWNVEPHTLARAFRDSFL
jgi:predicted RNase H-like nuclease